MFVVMKIIDRYKTKYVRSEQIFNPSLYLRCSCFTIKKHQQYLIVVIYLKTLRICLYNYLVTLFLFLLVLLIMMFFLNLGLKESLLLFLNLAICPIHRIGDP